MEQSSLSLTNIIYANMKIIRNNLLLPKRFAAVNLFGILLCRKETKVTPKIINHERIHTAQMIEMFVVFFYLWYVVEWLLRLPFKGNAYRNISFEREAYCHDDNLDYLKSRRCFAWWKFLRKQSKAT